MVTNKDSYINLSALPSELYLMWVQYPWPFGDLACDARIVITETIIYTSILTIVGFTCERWVHKNNISYISDVLCGRYWAICKPLSPFSRSSLSRAKRTIGIMWLFSFLTAFPWSFFTRYANEKNRKFPQVFPLQGKLSQIQWDRITGVCLVQYSFHRKRI